MNILNGKGLSSKNNNIFFAGQISVGVDVFAKKRMN